MLSDSVKEIIKTKFSLGENGYSEFLKIIKNNYVEHPTEYNFIFDEKEYRKIIRIPDNLKSYIDDGFPILKSLENFCEEFDIGYNEYNAGRVIIKGQERKLFKLMCEFYTPIVKNHLTKLGGNPDYGVSFSLVQDICCNKGNVFKEAFRCFDKYYKPSERKAYQIKLMEKNIESVEGHIVELLTKIYEKIGAFKIKADKDLYLIISKNLDDFFLCSWEQSWTSCLNPESSSSLWSALPFLLSDNGRCIIYITDLTPKEYHGIKSYKMFKRGWGIIGTNGKSEKIYTGLFYPSKTRMDNGFYLQMNFDDKIANMENNFISKYPLDLFYNKFNVFDYIYQDDTCFAHGYEGKVRLISGERNHTMFVNTPTRGIERKSCHMAEDGHTLSELIEKNLKIEDIPSDHFCPECKKMIYDGRRINVLIDGIMKRICNECFDSYIKNGVITCSHCKQQIGMQSDILILDGSLVCSKCYLETIKQKSENNFERMFGKLPKGLTLSTSSLRVPNLEEIRNDQYNIDEERNYDDEDNYNDDDIVDGDDEF
jgi:hypothetical protein